MNTGGLMLGAECGMQSYLVREKRGIEGGAPLDLNYGGFYTFAKLGIGL